VLAVGPLPLPLAGADPTPPTPSTGRRPVPVVALAYSPDGKALVSNGDRQLDIRAPGTGVIQRSVVCDLPKLTGLAFAPGGDRLAVAGGEPGVAGEVRILTWPEGRLLQRLPGAADLAQAVAFDASGQQLAWAAADHSAQLWRCPPGQEAVAVCRLTGHAGPVLAVGFLPSGQALVTAGADRSLKVWATDDGRLLRSLNSHQEALYAVAFRPVGATGSPQPVTCATASEDRTVRIWQPEVGRLVRTVRGAAGAILTVVWSPDGQSLFTAGTEGKIRRVDAGSDTIQAVWQAHDDWIQALAVSPDGRWLASGDWAGRVQVRDPQGSP
jgi:WD40 repeat protein